MTDKSWLIDRFAPESPAVIKYLLEELYKIGEVARSEEKELYKIPHSSLAMLYFEVTKIVSSCDGLKIYGNEKEYCCSYVLSEYSSNWLDILVKYSVDDSREKI